MDADNGFEVTKQAIAEIAAKTRRTADKVHQWFCPFLSGESRCACTGLPHRYLR